MKITEDEKETELNSKIDFLKKELESVRQEKIELYEKYDFLKKTFKKLVDDVL
jgi:predicted nuclease with TOPRIM domain